MYSKNQSKLWILVFNHQNMFPGKMLKKQITTDFFKNISRIITILKIRLSTIFSALNASQCNDYQSERYLLFSSSNFQLSCEQCIASQLLWGPFINYVYKTREVGGPKMSTFCQRSYHRKCQRRGVGGQEKTKCSLWTTP